METRRAAPGRRSPHRPPSKDSVSRGDQCAALPGQIRLRLEHAAQQFPSIPNRVVLVPSANAALPVRTVRDLALTVDRMCEQRKVVPSAGIVDS